MWDIKFISLIDAARITKEYYLNHVGYKVVLVKKCRTWGDMYYLNHVGYKVRKGGRKKRGFL